MNQNLLLNLIRTHAPISRIQLGSLSGLSTGTVVSIVSELLKHELVIESGVADSNLGRKAGLIELNPEGGYVIGLSLVEDDRIALVLLNLLGEIVCSSGWNTPMRNQAESVIQIITDKVKAFIAQCKLPHNKILGLGCGLPGNVNTHTGRAVDNWIHNWHDLPISSPLSEALNMPVYIDNVVNCLGSYAKLFGDGKQYQDFLMITLGRGVGMAMLLHGDLYRGARGAGGEFGHIPAVPGGRLCECGKRGCLEAYVADHGLLKSYRELCQARPDDPLLPTGLSLAEIQLAARQGNEALQSILQRAGTLLGIGLATMVNIFNPECLLITGNAVSEEDLIFAAMRDALREHVFSRLGDDLPIMIKPTTDNSWAQGAGALVLRRFFLTPLQTQA
jgi:predicted NBD/HSP70 family sugar kinase